MHLLLLLALQAPPAPAVPDERAAVLEVLRAAYRDPTAENEEKYSTVRWRSSEHKRQSKCGNVLDECTPRGCDYNHFFCAQDVWEHDRIEVLAVDGDRAIGAVASSVYPDPWLEVRLARARDVWRVDDVLCHWTPRDLYNTTKTGTGAAFLQQVYGRAGDPGHFASAALQARIDAVNARCDAWTCAQWQQQEREKARVHDVPEPAPYRQPPRECSFSLVRCLSRDARWQGADIVVEDDAADRATAFVTMGGVRLRATAVKEPQGWRLDAVDCAAKPKEPEKKQP